MWQLVKQVSFPSPYFLWWMHSFSYVRGFPMRFFYTVTSFNEASEDTGFHCICFFSLQLFVAILAVSFSPSLLRSFASSVRGEVSE